MVAIPTLDAAANCSAVKFARIRAAISNRVEGTISQAVKRVVSVSFG
jgi:hypothetical protein